MLTKKQKIFLVIYTILLITYHYDQYKKAEFEMEMKYRHSKVVDFYDEYYYKTKWIRSGANENNERS